VVLLAIKQRLEIEAANGLGVEISGRIIKIEMLVTWVIVAMVTEENHSGVTEAALEALNGPEELIDFDLAGEAEVSLQIREEVERVEVAASQ